MKHPDDIAAKCAALDPRYGVDAAVAERIARFAAHLAKWQKAINLIGRSTEAKVWERHILDSLQLVPLISAESRVIVDLGSGAGFPGMILALFGRWEVHLVESDTRKAVFLRDSARACGVAVEVMARRIETVEAPKADVVTARALAPVAELLRLSAGIRRSGTICLFPKGRGVQAELTDAEKTWTLRFDTIPSITDPHGVILKIDEAREHGSGSTA
ncbi:16S rRNA (guanine(527)-N(7))-methyltransferase RsmG [Oleispirillum naphthae]|uniref:16S rRNA (guanine(527)-N(7))-methyltransferase RsmG n=1 Tax=Oleispirillum naphthae TaxID=2838853 RepID=UPI00308244B6